MAVDKDDLDEWSWRYWCWSVSLMCKSVVKQPFESFTVKSKHVTFSLLDSWVNLMLLSKLLRSSKNFSSLSLPWVQIKKMSSMYLNHTKGCSDWDCKNLVSSSSVNI